MVSSETISAVLLAVVAGVAGTLVVRSGGLFEGGLLARQATPMTEPPMQDQAAQDVEEFEPPLRDTGTGVENVGTVGDRFVTVAPTPTSSTLQGAEERGTRLKNYLEQDPTGRNRIL